jgi:hypothetical protein
LVGVNDLAGVGDAQELIDCGVGRAVVVERSDQLFHNLLVDNLFLDELVHDRIVEVEALVSGVHAGIATCDGE